MVEGKGGREGKVRSSVSVSSCASEGSGRGMAGGAMALGPSWVSCDCGSEAAWDWAGRGEGREAVWGGAAIAEGPSWEVVVWSLGTGSEEGFEVGSGAVEGGVWKGLMGCCWVLDVGSVVRWYWAGSWGGRDASPFGGAIAADPSWESKVWSSRR